MDDIRSTNVAIFCLLSLVRYHGLAAGPAQLKHPFTDSTTQLDDTGLLRIARFLKFKARKVSTDVAGLENLLLPVIVKHTDGHYFLVAKMHEGKALIQDPLKGEPERMSFDVLRLMYSATPSTGWVIPPPECGSWILFGSILPTWLSRSVLILCSRLYFFAVMYVYSPVPTWIVLSSIPFFVILSATPIHRARLNEKF